MQQSRVVEAVIRLFAAFSEAIIAYMIYLFMNYFWFYAMSGVGLLTTIAVALGSVCLCFLVNSKRVPEGTGHFIIGAAGLVISAGIIAVSGLKGLSIITSVVLLLFVWLRGVHYANVDNREIYSIDQFRYGMLALLVMNFLAYIITFIKEFSLIISRSTVLYAVIGIFVLTKCKELQFCHLEHKKRNGRADIAASIGLLTVIIMLSSRKVLDWGMHGLYLAGILIVEVLYRVMFSIGYAIYRIILPIIIAMRNMRIPLGLIGVGADELKKYEDFTQKPWVELLLKIVACLVIAAAVVLVLAYIRRLLKKSASKSTEEDYTEDREFIIGKGSIRNEIAEGLKGIIRAIGTLGLHKQTNREKIRSEYKRLLSLLWKKSVIGSNETAERVGDILSAKYPQVEQDIQKVTKTYEKVRYGGLEPKDEEVREFRDGIVGIRSSITAS